MKLFTALCVFLVVLTDIAVAENWPQWRGPDANGISQEEGVPTRWSQKQNVRWKASLPGLGSSSPIVWGDLIFLTSQMGDVPIAPRSQDFPGAPAPRKSGDQDQVYFVVQAFHRRDGSLKWEYKFKAEGNLPEVHIKHNLASPSCVTDGERVYAWMGSGQLVALDLEGKLVWELHLGQKFSPFDILWGHASSPALYKDSLILLCDHPPKSYLLALDKRTGKPLWKVDRGQGFRSYTTPFVFPGEQGDVLVINSNRRIDVFDPSTGELLWYVGEPNRVPIPMPVYHHGVLYVSRGYRSSPYLAVRVGGTDDVNRTHLKWRVPTGAPYISSLLYYQGLIYMASESGIVTCVDAETGETVWKERFGGVFTASPVAADGKVYLLNEEGDTFILKAGRELNVLERNRLGERTLASPAISDGQLFIRTDQHLYCIGQG
jgi:outer membrane protein assembly factor BamB